MVMKPEATASTVRQTQPGLVFAILSTASQLFSVALQSKINKELLETFADLTLVAGAKSVELSQALQVGTI